MSSLLNAHIEIARERYLEILAADPRNDAGLAARVAIAQADTFVEEYAKRVPVMPVGELVKKQKGCSSCFGSGGKIGKPCKACGGSGKVPA